MSSRDASTATRDLFVGRERELALLEARLADAAAGRGAAVLLAGEPGIGKTRTAGELARRARAAGAEVLIGRCYEGEGAPAFWPWTEVLRSYVRARDAATLQSELGTAAADVAGVYPELRTWLPEVSPPPVMEPAHARFRFFDGVTGALTRAAERRPIVVLLDDLHGADAPSLLLLQFLARALRNARILVVGGLRELALAGGHPVGTALGELVREGVGEWLTLGGLTETEVATLLEGLADVTPPAGLAAAVQRRTEGNPLYVTELGRALLASGVLRNGVPEGPWQLELPATVRLAITRRLATLTAPCRELLTLAALFGREADRAALLRASGHDRVLALALLDEAVAARLVSVTPQPPERIVFAHALIAETLAQDVPGAERAALHRRAAVALAAEPPAADHATEIAHHWGQAGPAGEPEEAVAWAWRAGEQALAALAYEEAARLYQMALTALGWTTTIDPAREAEVLLALGEAHKRAGAIATSRQVFARAAKRARHLGSAELLTRAAIGFAPSGNVATQPDPDPAVVRLLEEAIAAWDGRDSGLHARALARLGAALLFGDGARRTIVFDTALAMVRRIGDPTARRDVIAASVASFYHRDDLALRLALSGELVALAEATNALEALAVGRLWHGVHLLEIGDAHGMRREVAALVRLARELRQPFWSWYAGIVEGSCAVLDGRLIDAERAARAAYAIGQAAMPYAAHGYFFGQMLVIRTLAGEPDEFVAGYRAAVEAHPDPTAVAPLAWAAARLGRQVEARAIVERVTAHDFAHVLGGLFLNVTLTFLAEACAALDDHARAARVYELLLPSRASWVVWAEGVPVGPVAHSLGLLARCLGRLDDAAGYFEEAIRATREAGAPVFLAQAQTEYAVLLRRRNKEGDRARAEVLLVEAHGTAARLGMMPLAARCAALGSETTIGGPPAGTPAPRAPSGDAAPSEARNVCRCDGDYWTITYAGRTVHLRTMRGLDYLVQLLRAPGREVHASALVGTPPAGASHSEVGTEMRAAATLGDAGPPLDAPARRAYRDRLAALTAEVVEAERLQDLDRADACRAEIEMLTVELRGAAKGHRAASHAERARVAVTKGLTAALARIRATHPALGAHLQATIKRGYVCAYVPDPRHPIEWET
jgi:tetratricopeptide (TPR) repeat protein